MASAGKIIAALKWPPTSLQLVRRDQTRGRRASINTHESTSCGRKSANSPGPAEDAGAIHWGVSLRSGMRRTQPYDVFQTRRLFGPSPNRKKWISKFCVHDRKPRLCGKWELYGLSGSTIPPSSAATAQNRKAGETDFERGWIFGEPSKKCGQCRGPAISIAKSKPESARQRSASGTAPAGDYGHRLSTKA